jgi:8-amino-7-oxononanoate synthase
MYTDDFLLKKLTERKEQDAFRQLSLPDGKIDFCSNDYLGLASRRWSPAADSKWHGESGSTGSRLLSGNYKLITMTEKYIADFHVSESALIFNSGYDVNIGLLSSVPQKGDSIVYDALSHASLRDGIRLSFAHAFSFAHNDMDDLEKKLKQVPEMAGSTIFVVTESVFSMEGDMCPLNAIMLLCEKYHAHLIIDEAHATGVIGKNGEGLVQQLQFQDRVFARIHTFGKACGCHGAVVLGSRQLIDYLINFARSFIYSTALPPHAIAMIADSYRLFPTMIKERNHLGQLILQFQSVNLQYEKLVSLTPIQGVMVPGNKEVKSLARKLQENNLDVRPVLYPTVPKNKERLRIILHSFNTMNEINQLIELLK